MAATPAEGGGLDRHPTFGLWPVALREDLRASIAAGTRRVVDWIEARGCARAVFHGSDRPFFNINTPADLARAEAMIAAEET
jgi:molybdopterin-guanine dinucleotide biosynthesis protein A